MDFSLYDHPSPDFESQHVELIIKRVYGVDGQAEALPGDRDANFLIRTDDARYALKVGNRGDHPESLIAQAAATKWAQRNGPDLPLAGVVRTANGFDTGLHEGHRLLLTEFVEGSSMKESPSSPGSRREVAALAGRLVNALSGFAHPFLERSFPWNLLQVEELRSLIPGLGSNTDRVVAALDRFQSRTDELGRLQKQAIHADLNAGNLVVSVEDPEQIVGVFDLGDIMYAPAIVELAIAATYQAAFASPRRVLTEMAPAFHLLRPLTREEIELTVDLMAARCAQSLLMSARQRVKNPENERYLTSDRERISETLEWFTDANRAAAVESAVAACGLDGGSVAADSGRARRQHMFSGYRMSYTTGVHAESANGVWINEADGSRLLDCYNNVPHVGHGHPRVVAAVSAQMRRLNTNTRYLVDGVGEYAARLANLLPDPLSVVFFTNSGSEANDLAYRLACVSTGREVVLTSENAYHGATTIAASMSPEEHSDSPLEGLTRRIDLQPSFLAASHESDFEDSMSGVAMVIVDTIFSTEGIHDASHVVRSLRRSTQQSGALLVADEVQAGFGRVGRRFWGFGDVVPDIVTLGKPIANGYPMGAVATTPEIAEAFAESSSYFSTFAGSPVATAAASAVLDVIEDEELAAHSEVVGEKLRKAIGEIDSSSIVSVRGAGLFVGVQLADDRTAMRVVDDMRDRGVLIGRTGPAGDVLKLRPPLAIQGFHVERVVAELADVLRM